MIFRFIVRRLRWLARVPSLPQLFDALLLAFNSVVAPQKLRAIEGLEEAASRELAATTRVHRFGGTGFYLDGAELGHVHGNGLVDVRVGPTARDRLVAAGQARPHHLFPSSGWVSFWMKEEADIARALELLRVAAARHAAPTPIHASPGVAAIE